MKELKKTFYLNKRHTNVCLFDELKYIKNLYDVEISAGDEIYTYSGTMNSIVNYICHRELKDYNTVVKISKKLFNLSSKVPVYVKNDLILLLTGSLRNYETEVFNFCMIDNIYKDGNNTVIIFKDGTRYLTKTSYNSLKKSMDICSKIELYFKKRV